MPRSDPVNWQPISEMPLIASMIDGALDDTREHLGTLTDAKARPHLLDDATIDRVEQVHTEQMEFIDIYTQQISRWRTEKPSASQAREMDRMAAQNERLRAVTAEVLALARELRKGTIERVLGMNDVELWPSGAPRQPINQPPLSRPITLRAIPLPCSFTRMGLVWGFPRQGDSIDADLLSDVSLFG